MYHIFDMMGTSVGQPFYFFFAPRLKKRFFEMSDNENAWKDDDDINLNVDVSQAKITKKLRHSYDEKILKGPTYEERLRQQ